MKHFLFDRKKFSFIISKMLFILFWNFLLHMEKYIQLFVSLWIPKKWAKIYLSLLEYGKSSVSDIQNNTNIHRIEIYRIIPLLIENWLVIVDIKWKRKLYKPWTPTKIEELYKEMQESNKGVINHLIQKYENLEKKTSIRYKEGKIWVKEVFKDIIDSQKKWDVFYRITSETDTEKINSKYLPKDYREKRDEKDLERFVIMSSKSWQKKQKRLERELRFIPKNIDEFDDNIFMSIYAEKIAYIDFNTETSIIIENQQIADFQKKLFKLLFKFLR